MRKKLIYFLPCLISIVYVSVLAHQVFPHFLAVHDSPLKLMPAEIQASLFSFWNKNSFGYTDYIIYAMSLYPLNFSHILLTLGFPTLIMQLLLYFVILTLLMYASWFSIYKFLGLLGYKNTLWPSFFGSLFFSTNLYMTASWHGGSIDGLFVTYAISPILLYLLTKNIIYPITTKDRAIYTILFVASLNTVPFAAAVIAAYTIPFFYIKIVNKQVLTVIKNFSAIFVATIFLSLGYLYIIFLAFLRSDPMPLRNNATAYAFSDYGLLGHFKVYFDWTINQIWGSRYFHSYFPYIDHPHIEVAPFILWLGICGALVLKIKSLPKQLIGYILAIITLSLFISKSLNEPLGFINKALYDFVPLMNLFRTPDTKFGLTFVTAMSFLVGLSLTVFQKKRSVFLVIVASILLHISIFFTGIPVIETKVKEMFTRIVKIPHEYRDIAKVLNSDAREGYVLMYPGLSYGNYSYMNGFGLNGQDILGKLIERPKVYSDGFIFGRAEKRYQELTSTLSANTLGQHSIRYLVLRKDIHEEVPAAKRPTIQPAKTFTLVYSSQIADVFEIHPDTYRPYITASKGPETIPVSYEEIFPSLYRVTLAPNHSLVHLQFNTSFHPDWMLYSFDNIKIESHRINPQQSNTWIIRMKEQKEDDMTAYIVFVPQYVFVVPVLVSFICLALFIIRYKNHVQTQK